MSLIPGTGSPDAISAATAANERGYGGCPEDCAGSEDDAGEMEGGFEEGGTAALLNSCMVTYQLLSQPA